MPANSKILASIFDPTVALPTWTVTWTNLTVGSGTTAPEYFPIGKWTFAQIKFTLNGSTMGTNPTANLPVPAHARYQTDDLMGIGQALDAGINVFPVSLLYAGSSKVYWKVSAVSPFTFGNGDSLHGMVFYEAA